MSRININSNNNTDAERIEETMFRARAGFRNCTEWKPLSTLSAMCTVSVFRVRVNCVGGEYFSQRSCHILTANLSVSECIHNSMKLASYAEYAVGLHSSQNLYMCTIVQTQLAQTDIISQSDNTVSSVHLLSSSLLVVIADTRYASLLLTTVAHATFMMLTDYD